MHDVCNWFVPSSGPVSWCKQGLHVGGLEDINRLLRLGQIQADNIQVLVGCAAWTPGQLRNEIWLGCWHVLAASNSVLHECLFGGPSSVSCAKACKQRWTCFQFGQSLCLTCQ